MRNQFKLSACSLSLCTVQQFLPVVNFLEISKLFLFLIFLVNKREFFSFFFFPMKLNSVFLYVFMFFHTIKTQYSRNPMCIQEIKNRTCPPLCRKKQRFIPFGDDERHKSARLCLTFADFSNTQAGRPNTHC